MKGHAYAKINLGLRVRSARPDGYHPIVSLAQSVDWADTITLERAGDDRFDVAGHDVPPGDDNLAWRAVATLRGRSGPGVHMHLDKSIAVAAGLGGGSADAALGLVLAVGVLGLEVEAAVGAAVDLGADVPFCLVGGTAWMEGIGDRLTSLATPGGYWLGLVVPPFELGTPSVYRRWDEMGGPQGREVDGSALPVSLRDHGPLANDLQPAAVDLAPGLGDWISDLEGQWGQPVLMSGSGPTLFGFFPTESEAADAVGKVRGSRAVRVVRPVDFGWIVEDPGGLPPAPWR
jgi:4-diphosphocytidyl-2-C-methyl-D-erythritol kinase